MLKPLQRFLYSLHNKLAFSVQSLGHVINTFVCKICIHSALPWPHKIWRRLLWQPVLVTKEKASQHPPNDPHHGIQTYEMST